MIYVPWYQMQPIYDRSQHLANLLSFSILVFTTIVLEAPYCNGHGRLIEPPSRASAWRYGFQTPPDYNDHELYCGGFTRQWKRNEGKCGECGDAWDLPEPRPHEQGGQWGQGVIVRRYNPGSNMTIRIELTASHMGYFEFRLCPDPHAKQACLDKNLLLILSGAPAMPSPTDLDTRFYPRNGSRIYEIKARLPDIDCHQCVLQWRYVAGNNWGMCPDGNGAVGCGPQEEFRSCSDIALGEGAPTTLRPFRPTLRPKTSTSTETTLQDGSSGGFDFGAFFLGFFLFTFICLIIIAGLYLYYYRRQKLKKWVESMSDRLCKKSEKRPTMVATASHTTIVALPSIYSSSIGKKVDKGNSILDIPPVPPPRTKRQSRSEEDRLPNESSSA